MNFLALALAFLGYTLVYAATANHGRFATAPWTGVVADAYEPPPGAHSPTPPPPPHGNP